MMCMDLLGSSWSRESIGYIEEHDLRVNLGRTNGGNGYVYTSHTLSWNPETTRVYDGYEPDQPWFNVHPLAALGHELNHAILDRAYGYNESNMGEAYMETSAVIYENKIRVSLFTVNPQSADLYPRPGYRAIYTTPQNEDGTFVTAAQAWEQYRQRYVGY